MPTRSQRRSSALAALALALCCAMGPRADPASAAERTLIGHSVRHRPLLATVIGDPSAADRVLVIGCVHGDEPAGIRGNAREVDLNRNFRFAWQALGGLEYSGPHALSEPESRAAERLIRRIEPDLTIWFHQPFGLVDRSGGTVAIERRYSELVGLPLVGLRRYPGSASSWQNHALPQSTAFVVELPRIVSGALVGRAARAVTTLLGEYASADLGEAGQAM